MFEKTGAYDPKIDTTVRVRAHRLRESSKNITKERGKDEVLLKCRRVITFRVFAARRGNSRATCFSIPNFSGFRSVASDEWLGARAGNCRASERIQEKSAVALSGSGGRCLRFGAGAPIACAVTQSRCRRCSRRITLFGVLRCSFIEQRRCSLRLRGPIFSTQSRPVRPAYSSAFLTTETSIC